MNEVNCQELVKKARFAERANSVTRIAIVGIAVAARISTTNYRIYGWLFVFGLVIHLLRIGKEDDSAASKVHDIFVWLEILFVIACVVVSMIIFLD